MPNPVEIANLGKFQMFLEMCEVTKTVGGKLPLDYTWFFGSFKLYVIPRKCEQTHFQQVKIAGTSKNVKPIFESQSAHRPQPGHWYQ